MKNYENIDIRTLPRDKRPKPTTGQSAPEREMPWDALNGDEQEIVKLLNGKGGARAVRTISYLAEGLDDDDAPTKLRIRNALRRVVTGGWAEAVERGTYRVTERGRKRLERAQA